MGGIVVPGDFRSRHWHRLRMVLVSLCRATKSLSPDMAHRHGAHPDRRRFPLYQRLDNHRFHLSAHTSGVGTGAHAPILRQGMITTVLLSGGMDSVTALY